MPFVVANDCLNTLPLWHIDVQVSGRYVSYASRFPDRTIGLDCYLATPKAWEWSAFDKPQGAWDKENFTGKMASRRDGF